METALVVRAALVNKELVGCVYAFISSYSRLDIKTSWWSYFVGIILHDMYHLAHLHVICLRLLVFRFLSAQ
ncbi:hypothetical protein BDQ17DRAFT_199360 [Cyathus striatus]|nr:hypothetical protein BDQ17DRAFT_199360 [Cyathus striatus]